MITTILHVWLYTGQIISGPIPASDCLPNITSAQMAIASGGYAELDLDGRSAGMIVRMQCDGHDVVLALPSSNGDCEEPTS